MSKVASPDLPSEIIVRVERTEYAEIAVNTALLIDEWGDDDEGDPWTRDDVMEALHQIGVTDLMYSGDFIEVLDRDTEDSISG